MELYGGASYRVRALDFFLYLNISIWSLLCYYLLKDLSKLLRFAGTLNFCSLSSSFYLEVSEVL